MAERLSSRAGADGLLLNLGPSHPSMHGIIRLMTELEAERVRDAEVEIGYLHRGFEKTAESRTWFNVLPYTDRLNYVSPLINNLAYALAVEKLLGLEVPERAQRIRVLLCELSRVADHLTCIGAMAMETGAFTVFLYMTKAREFLWDVIEQTTGARMTTSYIRVGGVRADLHPGCRVALKTAVGETREVLREVGRLLDDNAIFLDRTRGVGVMTREAAVSHGWTGPCLRSTGVNYDVRKARPYLVYDRLEFDVPLGEHGDNYDRYRVRMLEMEQSLRLVEQAAASLSLPAPGPAAALDPETAVAGSRRRRVEGPIRLSPTLEGSERDKRAGILAPGTGFAPPDKEAAYTSMEGLISHFQFFMKGRGLRPPPGEAYASVEGGNGEVGFYIVSDGSARPYRLHLRAPSFHHVSALESLVRGGLVADIIPTFGSLNMIGGELDR